MLMKSKLLLLILWSFSTLAAMAQQVEGLVMGTEGPVIGATVKELNSTGGTVTDQNGKFSLKVSDIKNAVIQVSFLGYKTARINVNGQSNLTINLEDDSFVFDNLVVVGYRSQKESDITGAVATVSAEDIANRRVADLAQALQGKAAGVTITQSTGAPGDPIEVRIRGNGTIGDNNPLYVIDGVPSRTIDFLNPANIKSMTVLKDAAAASIYGSRAAGGVVVIETKSGDFNQKGSVAVNYFFGVQKAVNLPKMLNASQYMNVISKAWENAGYGGTNPYIADMSRTDFADVNYLDELFENGVTNSVDIQFSGGGDKTSYSLLGGFYKQNGIIVYDNDTYQKINLTANINSKVLPRFTIGTNINISNIVQDKLSSKGDVPGIIRHAFLRPPIIPIYKQPGDAGYSVDNPFTDLPFYKGPSSFESSKYEYSQNPIAIAYFTDDTQSNFKTFGNVFGELALLKDKNLKLKSNLGVDINFFHAKDFNQNYGDWDGGGAEVDAGQGRINRPTSLAESRGEEFTFTWTNTLNYNESFGSHKIHALAGSEFITNNSSNLGATRARFDFEQSQFRYIDLGHSDRDLWNGGFAAEWALFSYFGSINYDFQEKYLFNANLRADASSRFGSENRWGYFPSFSAGWRIKQEPFMKDVNWLSDLKLRASWGQLGNQEVPNYAFLTLYQASAVSYQISRYGNPDLKWETTAQTDIGLDFSLMKNKLYGSIDYFDKTTSDILLPISLPLIVGNVAATYVNAGKVNNRGFEFELGYRNRTSSDFYYSINANLATIKNEVKSLHANLPNLIGPVTKTQAGYPLNAYYGFMQEGIYQSEEEVTSHLFGTPNAPQKPGDIKFVDIDNNGIINDNDRTFIGNPNPRYTYGSTVNLGYKGFDFNLLFQGVGDVDRYNDLKKIINYDTRPFNYTTDILDSWDGESSTNSIPRVSFSDNGSSKVSDIFVEDASYFRLKNIELGYTLNNPKLKKFASLRFYVSAQNVFTITNYSGLDAESTDLIDMGTYPQSRNILFGINAKF